MNLPAFFFLLQLRDRISLLTWVISLLRAFLVLDKDFLFCLSSTNNLRLIEGGLLVDFFFLLAEGSGASSNSLSLLGIRSQGALTTNRLRRLRRALFLFYLCLAFRIRKAENTKAKSRRVSSARSDWLDKARVLRNFAVTFDRYARHIRKHARQQSSSLVSISSPLFLIV